LTLADLSHLQVETTDLSERNVPQVSVGQRANVFIKALGQNVNGQVKEISPLADTLGGDVVYKTIISLDSLPEGIRVGMSVDVSFGGTP
jgi:macrolide-specific efflux system membrane fusion protein